MRQYSIAAAVFLGVYLGLLLLRRYVLERLRALAEEEGGKLRGLYAGLIDQFLGPEAPIVAFYVAARQLNAPPELHRALYVVVVVVISYRLIRLAQIAAAIAIRQIVESDDGAAHEGAIKNVTYIANVVVWAAGVLVALSNLGVNVTAVITGLGIGGIAVALAAQAILSDFFSAVAIFLDRPFAVGDVIALDKEWMGQVEKIGLKTTRVRAPSGEILVFPNSKLTSASLRNYGSAKPAVQ